MDKIVCEHKKEAIALVRLFFMNFERAGQYSAEQQESMLEILCMIDESSDEEKDESPAEEKDGFPADVKLEELKEDVNNLSWYGKADYISSILDSLDKMEMALEDAVCFEAMKSISEKLVNVITEGKSPVSAEEKCEMNEFLKFLGADMDIETFIQEIPFMPQATLQDFLDLLEEYKNNWIIFQECFSY